MTDLDEQQIVQDIAGSQSRLFAYILTLVGERDAASDILQETNLVLWQKRGDFQPGTSFPAWSFTVAFMQVMAHRRDTSRDQHRYFAEDLLSQRDRSRSAACGRTACCVAELPANAERTPTLADFQPVSARQLGQDSCRNDGPNGWSNCRQVVSDSQHLARLCRTKTCFGVRAVKPTCPSDASQ